MSVLSASTWGDPNATKHVLLIHGIVNSSQAWHRTALEFASRGYFVTAPDLLGHGNARRSSDYTIAALVEELRPLFTTPGRNDPPYHIVIGHSLGGIVTSVLLPLLKSTQPVHVVLIDPPFEQTPESLALHRKLFGDMIGYPKTPEAFLQENPLCTELETIFFSVAVRLCDVAAVEGIVDQNAPWSFSHQLSAPPDNVKVTVLAGDPSKKPGPYVREEDLKAYPHVTTKTVWGASHLIPFEFPLVVVETALEGTKGHS